MITAISIFARIDVPTVGDKGALPTTFPPFAIPNVPFNLETLEIIFPYTITLAIVGLEAIYKVVVLKS